MPVRSIAFAVVCALRRLACAAVGALLLVALAGCGKALGPKADALHLQADGSSAWSFGNRRLSIDSDPKTGWPTVYRQDGTVMLERDSSARFPVAFNGNPEEGAPVVFDAVEQVSSDTMCVRFATGSWRCKLFLQLYPDQGAVRRWLEFVWTGKERKRFGGIWTSYGKVACREGRGGYSVPGEFPPRRHECTGFREGRRIGGDGNVTAIVADDGEGRSYLACLGDMESYSDRGNVYAYECADGFVLGAQYHSFGYAKPGVPQTVGDTWVRFGRGTSESQLETMHDWHRLAGYLPPDDRPDRVRDLVICSMHPKGRKESGGADVGGFGHAAAYLPFLQALGCTCIWMRPVYHAGGYRPDKMYEMEEGIGSEADELSYVRSAHALGMEAWCDAVPHGGKTSNERTRQHPEWVCRKEDGSFQRDYWAYDFNWPTWVRYFSDWVEWYTRKYELDGWRMDVPTGSAFPNWNPDIPYARASYARRQGGIAQQKAIRAAARRVNPNSVTMGEENESSWSTVADMIYDQMLCHAHFHAFRERDAKSVVNDLRRWLHEQRLAFVPGSVWLRYPESHDSRLAAKLWGQACANALMAFSAWIEGVPLVCQGGETGAFEAWRHIFAVRNALPELRRGDVDYVSAQAPDGVFACTRTLGGLQSAVIINFNDTRMRGVAAGVPIDLPAYGYEVRRLKGPALEEALGPIRPYVPARKGPAVVRAGDFGLAIGEGVVAELRDPTNGLVAVKGALVRESTADGIRVSVRTGVRIDAKNVRLVVRFAATERWFAHTAEGSFENPFFVAHPGVVGKVKCWTGCNGGRLADPEVCWSNESHPFGFDRLHAEIGSASASGAYGVSGFRAGARVELRDRLGGEEGLAVTISGAGHEDLVCRIRRVPISEAFAAREPATGDDRLRPTAGGWMYDDGILRARFANSGAVVGAWTRSGEDWDEKLGPCEWYGLKTADFVSALGWGAREQKVALQSYDCYGRTVLDHDADGNLVLEFSEVLPAMFGKQYLSPALSCRARYVLGGGRMTAATSADLDRKKLRKGDVGRWEYRMASRAGLMPGALNAISSGVKPLAKVADDGMIKWIFIDGERSAYGAGSGPSAVEWTMSGRADK